MAHGDDDGGHEGGNEADAANGAVQDTELMRAHDDVHPAWQRKAVARGRVSAAGRGAPALRHARPSDESEAEQLRNRVRIMAMLPHRARAALTSRPRLIKRSRSTRIPAKHRSQHPMLRPEGARRPAAEKTAGKALRKYCHPPRDQSRPAARRSFERSQTTPAHAHAHLGCCCCCSCPRSSPLFPRGRVLSRAGAARGPQTAPGAHG